MPLNTPIASIVTSSIGRGAELKYGPGNNQYARASDVNPIIDYLNLRAGANATTGTAGNSATINAVAGSLTSASLTTVAAASQAITITNSNITSSSIVFANLDYAGSTGLPVIAETTVSSGQVVFTVTNIHASGALNGTVTIKFVVF